MKYSWIILVLVLLSLNLFGSDSSQIFVDEKENVYWSGAVAKDFEPIVIEKQENNPVPLERNLTLVDSFSLKEYISASNPTGYYYDVSFDRSTGMLNSFTNDYTSLTDSAEEAIQRSPLWMRPQLQQKMKSLSQTKQDYWAEVILNATDPYIDEIAFAIATLSTAYLTSPLAEPEVLITNAFYIYINDLFLDYAEVVDYGTSQTDEDYYTTVRYTKMNESGELEQVEIPKEIYYWDIAHPKVTGEIPAFIDPTILEYNHQGNIVSPDEGYFWRDYLFNYTFKDTLNLRNMMAGCEYVWDGIACEYPGIEWFAQPVSPYGDSLDYALHRLAKWINADMQFTSPGDRPHQPVRIAYKGMGRCGEYALLTTALGRALLLPTTNVSNWIYIWDHTFNEMWLEGWEHYESYYWEWGATFYGGYDYSAISPFETRSDGLLTTVTEHYVDYSTINLTILDENDDPVEGAKVKLFVQRPDEEILQSMVAYSDNNGFVHFTVSDGYDYFARAETVIGNSPTAGVSLLVSAPIAGNTYDLAMNVSASLPQTIYTLVDPPPNTADDYKVVVEFDVPQYAVIGAARWDDIGGIAYYANAIEDGNVDFFILDNANYDLFQDDQDINSVYAEIAVNSSSYEFDIPDEDDWHFIFSNKNHIDNHQYVEASVKLYQYTTSTNEDEIVSTNSLSNNFPNPFNPSTTISFSLAQSSKSVNLEIYNLKGQKVKTLDCSDSFAAASKKLTHSIVWNGDDENNKPVSSGIYFYRLMVENKIVANKRMLLLK